MEKEVIRTMIERAMEMLKFSYTPYSNFKVAAALKAKDGRIFGGCNIENAAYSPGNCAERTAFFKAVSEGVTEFDSIVILGGKNGTIENYCPPCGVCRQVMMEFCDPKTFQVILAKSKEEFKVFTLEEILPLGFGPKDLR
ncbi:MAG: cytidine deaminase [Clostridiales bacterium]|nr:cytidine deaminase [Clostridiales bacterium]